MEGCTNNPGHDTFIPIESFNLTDLPETQRDEDLYQLIKATADLTVKIGVEMTSHHRPDFKYNTKVPFYLSDMRGSRNLRTGSGKVWCLEKNKSLCPCSRCKRSGVPSKRWWKIYMHTAAQVLFDNVEAAHTYVRFFFDKEVNEEVLINDEIFICDKSVECDRCCFYCVTCDSDLTARLESSRMKFNDAISLVYARFRDRREIEKLHFIVSHPHGWSKRVSLGQWVEKRPLEGDDNQYSFTYTTSTCPGSIGAYVHSVGFKMLNQHFHSGTSQSGLNYSGFGFLYE